MTLPPETTNFCDACSEYGRRSSVSEGGRGVGTASLSLALRAVDVLDVLALIPLGRKRLAAVLAREPPVRPVLVILVLAPRAHVLEVLGARVAAVVALSTPAEVVVQPNRREVPAPQATSAAARVSACEGAERSRRRPLHSRGPSAKDRPPKAARQWLPHEFCFAH